MLLLFDLDGTLLLRASDAHRVAIHDGLRDVYGIAEPGAYRVAAAGRTDSAIAREIVARSGAPAELFDARLEEFRKTVCETYAAAAPQNLAKHLAPGVLELLAGLRGARLSLVTGNYEPIARLKLERAGIGHYFDAGQGAFGSDAERRELLPTLARARAGAYPRERTIVIGDTPLDIACARADGVRVFGIATGPFGAAQLGEADEVVADAHELRDLLSRELASCR